ncbi:hypothetical protein DFH09DRAFT_1079252 [Mycena vulgaris]|nr:hypothetical protein DFH09DRAFT_1079252 [Mycena vulgaris]
MGHALLVPLAPSPSISHLFPDIESTAISAVLSHTLRARDLYRLDPRVRDVEPTYVFNGHTSTFEPSTAKFRQYSSLDSVIFPLHNYFAILLAHNPNAHGLPVYLLSYLTQLQTLAADYAWDAVLEYHTLFFNRRSREMEASGDYSAWSGPDIALLCTSVYPYRASSSTTVCCLSRPSAYGCGYPHTPSFDANTRDRPRTRRRRPHRLRVLAVPTSESSFRHLDPT